MHRSTIYREIKRNQWTHWASKEVHYDALTATNKYLKRRQRPLRLSQNASLRKYVHDKLQQGWSPGQIEGRLKHENQGVCVISHETIYRYIYSSYTVRNHFYHKLRRQHFHRIKRNQRNPRVPKELLINQRPPTIEDRREFGHWEGDLMMFKRGIKGNLITLRERKTRYMIAIKNNDKTAQGTAMALIRTIKNIKAHVKSITLDQGSEFQRYSWIRDCLDAEVYFCKPASPYQKGSVENGNGVIRCLLPRSTNISELKQKDINQLADQINNRPLKCLSYQTPHEVFNNEQCARYYQ